ncbi:DDE superfamily endonuclease [Popillia japonica]|uniref:DDE superfamily endonuclease n=1 Tax=Popillia japonica TaxID=7064 RepID=A0AAW1LSX5_POPJA
MDIFDTSSSSSEDEEPVINRRIPSRIENFIERTIGNSLDREFQQHSRMNRVTYNQLLVRLTPSLEKQEGAVGRKRIPVERQLLAVLWLFSTPDSYRSVRNRFNMGKSSMFSSFLRVISALNEITPTLIKWHMEDEKQNIKTAFRAIAGMPGIIGAIGGTYVPIKAPRENPESYINRKCFHGITLQAICQPNLMFTDCFTGYPSSVSDIRMFSNSGSAINGKCLVFTASILRTTSIFPELRAIQSNGMDFFFLIERGNDGQCETG